MAGSNQDFSSSPRCFLALMTNCLIYRRKYLVKPVSCRLITSSSLPVPSLSCQTPLSPRNNHPLSLMAEVSFSRVFSGEIPCC